MMFGRGTSGVCPWCGAGYSSTDMWLLALFGLLVLAGVIVLVVWIVRSIGHAQTREGSAPPAAGQDDSAARIARERLARGEINRDEFDELMRALKG